MLNNSMKRLIHVTNRDRPEKYNILTFASHERYETQLCKTGHNFYSFNKPEWKKWNESQVSIPSNYHVLPTNRLYEHIEYDFILAQNRFSQLQFANSLSPLLHIPIISLEHTLPTPATHSPDQLNAMRSIPSDINVFISEHSRAEWNIHNNSHIIHHGIDSEIFKPVVGYDKEKYILTVANDFINRDFCLNYSGWQRVTSGTPTRLVGDTKGISQPAASIEELIEEYNTCCVYFNSTTISPIPMSLLEAMSCGCAVVSTATGMIPSIIENGINGFISNDETELRQYIKQLMNDDELRIKVGRNARNTILSMFSEEEFIKNWNNIFNIVYEVSTI